MRASSRTRGPGATLSRSRGRAGGVPGSPGVPSPMCAAAPGGEALAMITVDHLTKSYRGVTAVDDVSFTARPGRVTGFLGPNGAGKSTTMRIMVGLTPAGSGTRRRPRRPLRRPAEPGSRGRRPARRLGPARRPYRPGDPHPRRPHHGAPRQPGGRDAGAGLAQREGGRPQGAQLLARHAPAARHRHRAHRRPCRADPGRAGQRARPGRHPLDARPAAGVRRPGRDRAALLPPAARDRGDRRRPRGHRPRPDRRPGDQAGAAVGGRDGRLRPTTSAVWPPRWPTPASAPRSPAAARSTPTPTPTPSAGSPWRPASP